MARRAGLFTRQSAKEVRKEKHRPARPTAETLQALGPEGARQMNPDAVTPMMEPQGAEDPLVYILGPYPRAVDDSSGQHYAGAPGEYLFDALPNWAPDVTRYGYCVRTLPKRKKGSYVVKPQYIECFRAAVRADIAKSKPKVVLGLGELPLSWMLGLKNVAGLRGKRYPVDIEGHQCWFLPTMAPEWLVAAKMQEDQRIHKVPLQEWERFWKMDLRNAYELADRGEPPVLLSEQDIWKGVTTCSTLGEVLTAIAVMCRSKVVGFDTETHRFRPYHKDSKLLTLALSNGDHTYAFSIDHSGHVWTKEERRQIVDALRGLFTSKVTCVAHNLSHDLEWLAWLCGNDVLTGTYGCSQAAAFVLNPGPPGMGAAGHALDDLCQEAFGLPLKSMTPGAKFVARLQELPVQQVLEYNALDAKWCRALWHHLMHEVKEQRLTRSYKIQVERVPTLVNAQIVGVPIDQDARQIMDVELTKQIALVEAEIMEDSVVVKWKKKHPDFSPTSPKMYGEFLDKCLNVPNVRSFKGVSTSALILDPIRRDYPTIDAVLRLRGLEKLLGTYVRRFDPSFPDSYVFPDGKIHCKFTTMRARTARLASESPNNQNWPARRNKEVRKQLAAPDGCVWVAADQGQIEARVLAMESCDPTWVGMIEKNYDVHQEWAQKIAGISEPFAKLLDEEPKKARHKSKNGWVFPAFYGSSLGSIIRNLELDEVAASADDLFHEFWDTFKGVKRWQRRQAQKYERMGYVTSLTGRRRWGPLSYNMCINSPIQCTASDICVDAMVRLFNRSLEENKPWLAAVLQIHDDLSFLVPEDALSDTIAAVVEEQLGFDAPWVNVPLSVEVKTGKNLAEMQVVGEWTSYDLED